MGSFESSDVPPTAEAPAKADQTPARVWKLGVSDAYNSGVALTCSAHGAKRVVMELQDPQKAVAFGWDVLMYAIAWDCKDNCGIVVPPRTDDMAKVHAAMKAWIDGQLAKETPQAAFQSMARVTRTKDH